MWYVSPYSHILVYIVTQGVAVILGTNANFILILLYSYLRSYQERLYSPSFILTLLHLRYNAAYAIKLYFVSVSYNTGYTVVCTTYYTGMKVIQHRKYIYYKYWNVTSEHRECFKVLESLINSIGSMH